MQLSFMLSLTKLHFLGIPCFLSIVQYCLHTESSSTDRYMHWFGTENDIAFDTTSSLISLELNYSLIQVDIVSYITPPPPPAPGSGLQFRA